LNGIFLVEMYSTPVWKSDSISVCRIYLGLGKGYGIGMDGSDTLFPSYFGEDLFK